MSDIAGDYRTVSALFDTHEEASRAIDRLIEAGIPQGDVSLVSGGQDQGVVEDRTERHRGFFGALADFFFPEEDRYTYAEGLSRGGYLVVVNNLAAGLQDTALDILDDEGTVDLEAREASWRSEGWSGYDQAAAPYVAGERAAASDRTLAADRAFDEDESESIPVIDEQLVVGKRDVNLGRVRVRSYVREEPVSTDVNLHSEHVTIERRPVDRRLTDADVAFQDRTIEAEEHAEEAVIGKEARVTEEISLRREETDRTERVEDTVRKTEVSIDDERDGGRRIVDRG